MRKKDSDKWGSEFEIPPEVLEILGDKESTHQEEIDSNGEKRDKPCQNQTGNQQPITREKPISITFEPKDIEVCLGTDNSTGKSVFWSPTTDNPQRLANAHVLIVGKSGSGKTQTTMAFIYDLLKSGIPSIIFDFHDEYINKDFVEATDARIIDANKGIKLNPLDIPYNSVENEWFPYEKVVYQVSNSISRICELGVIQESNLRKAIFTAFQNQGFSNTVANQNFEPPTLNDVWNILLDMQSKNANINNLIARIEPIFNSRVLLGGENSISFEQLISKLTILRLANLATEEFMAVLCQFILQKIYINMLSSGPADFIRMFCIIDEAHKLYGNKTLVQLIKEARKYGIGLILSSQEAKDFDTSMFSNTASIICLQSSNTDAKRIAENIGLIGKKEIDIAREEIMALNVGQALLINDHYKPYTNLSINPFKNRINE